MSATAADSQTLPALPELKLAPLDAARLTPAVAKLMAAAAPAKVMAAKGIAALRPGELLTAIYQLSFDADASIKAATEAAPGVLPDKILVPALTEALPAEVLHFFALRIAPTRGDSLEKILYNQAAADETFVALAGRLAERELEIMFQNEARILRCPFILQALYFNGQARMSSLNRAIELCARNGIRIEGIPAFDEVAKSIIDTAVGTAPSTELAATDETFQEVIETEAAVEPPVDVVPSKPSKRKAIIDFTRLKLHEKVRLAALGNAYCREHLLRDPNRIVAMAAIRSPRITESEVAMAAGNRQVCEEVIRYIANQRDLMKMYSVKLSLVKNPKCPLAMSVKFLSLLQADDVKALAKSKNVPVALANAARRLLQQRGPAGG